MPVLKLDGDAKGAVRATSDVAAGVANIAKESKQLALNTEQLREQLAKAYDEKPIDAYIRKCEELAKKLVDGKITVYQYTEQTDRMSKGLKVAGEAHSHSFGSEAISELAAYAGGLFTVHKAIEFVTEALAAQNEEKKRAAEFVAGGLGGAGAIANASPNQASFEHNISVARQLMSEGLVPREQQDTANRTAAGMGSAQLSHSEEEFLFKLGKQKRIGGSQLGEFAETVRRFQEAYGPKAGSFEDVSKQFIAASEDTYGLVSPNDIGMQTADLARQAQEEGLTPQQVMAMYVTAARTSKSKKGASSRLKQMIDDGDSFEGSEAATYAREIQTIQGAPNQNIVDYISTDPRLSAARGVEEAFGERGRTIEEFASERESLYQEIWQRRRTAHIKQYGTGFRGSIVGATDAVQESLGRTAGGEDLTILQAAATSDSQNYPVELLGRMANYLHRQTEVAERNERRTPPPSGKQE